jgi:U3 small nucleolar RNA-associated protein 13
LKSHVSVVRGLAFCQEYLFTGARDKVIIKWNTQTGEQLQTILALESIESLKLIQIHEKDILVSAGEHGILKTWDINSGEMIDSQTKELNQSHPIVAMELFERKLVAVTGDQNIQLYNLDGINLLKYSRQIAGYNEEILDMELVGTQKDSHLAVITNTEQIRLYDLKTFDCDIIYGHSDIVLCLASSYNNQYIVTGSKDNTAKVWNISLDNEIGERIWEHNTLKGHTGAVSAVAMPKTSNECIITASQDRTIKFWYVDKEKGKTRYTFHAHDKDIQSLDLSPNDQFIVSSSLDKTAKVKCI